MSLGFYNTQVVPFSDNSCGDRDVWGISGTVFGWTDDLSKNIDIFDQTLHLILHLVVVSLTMLVIDSPLE